jgi:hypothetical protein
MMQTGDDRSSRRKPSPSDILSITNLAWNGLDSKLGIRGDRPAKIRLSHCKDFEIRKKVKSNFISNAPRYPEEKFFRARFPGFASLPFWYGQRVVEDEYAALVE